MKDLPKFLANNYSFIFLVCKYYPIFQLYLFKLMFNRML